VSDPIFDRRTSGILLHPTSLPGDHGVGDLGPAAHAFADFLADAAQSWWQMLPLGPPGAGNSPYDSPSSFAGSSQLVSLDLLSREGWLTPREIRAPDELTRSKRARYKAARRFKEPLLRLAEQRWRGSAGAEERARFEQFKSDNASWLDDYALYSALKAAHSERCWVDWDRELRDREPAALERARRDLAGEVSYHEFVQYEFDRQWTLLRSRCRELGISLLGDIPMFVAFDGADVWAHREVFHLDETGRRSVVAGVPPDAFSETGQLWGNPLYRWDELQRTNYAWWVERLRVTLRRFDAVRLDHFIGFRRCWEIPAESTTAIQGRFVPVPGDEFFESLQRALGGLPFIAEDLGIVTAEVHALRDKFALPGMRVLQFAFSDPNGSDYLPHRYPRHAVVYSGTHDNDTTVGWYEAKPPSGRAGTAHREERDRVLRYVGGDGQELHWDVIRVALMSVANTALFPLQDLLGLGSSARMNTPGTIKDNWEWRFRPEQLTRDVAARMAILCKLYDRAPPAFARRETALDAGAHARNRY
jgi:4-alpha-glucanotransferase